MRKLVDVEVEQNEGTSVEIWSLEGRFLFRVVTCNAREESSENIIVDHFMNGLRFLEDINPHYVGIVMEGIIDKK